MNEKQKVQSINENWGLLLVAGIISLVFGIIIASWPKASTTVLVIIIGIAVLLLGIVAFIRSFTLIKKTKTWWFLLIEGIVGIVIAIVLFVWPVGITAILAYIIGALLVIVGILAIIYGSKQKSLFSIIGGILSLIVGLVILFTSPTNAFSILMVVFGIFLIIRGIIMITQSINLKKRGSIV